MRPGTAKTLDAIINAALCGELDKTRARGLHDLEPEAVALALLGVSKHIAEQEARIAEPQGQSEGQQPSPLTPSGMVPVYAKPNAPRRCKKPGAGKGHPGHRRKTPARIDRRETHRLKRCPCCGGRLQRCERRRTRLIEGIPEEIEPVITEHTIHRDYCPKC